MGKMGRKRGGKKAGKPNKEATWGTKNKPDGYDEAIKENAAFETYYKIQNIVPDGEWDSFMSCLKEPLPVSFRISGHRSQAKAMLKMIQGEYFQYLTDDHSKLECLAWYPENLAWQLNLSRKDIRKSEAHVKLHNFLVSETNAGYISRQETVSMIPPLVLDVQSHHKVLDMCAAPGSKTTQLVEMLHSDDSRTPTGLVVANDANNKRCYLLTHQLKRLPSPNLIIINHDASIMPNFHITTPDGGKGILKFDRILCDVPCTGDGTLRKNLDVWMKWNTANAASLHGLQYRIARRGAEMLAIDGKMVYSTCSLNPIEDEAVIHRLLLEAQGSLVLEEVAEKVPGLKYVPGLSHWTVMSRDLTTFKTPEEVPETLKHSIRGSLFPPKAEDADKFNLKRCLRILPHQQNTGGFFVAVLKKIASLPWEAQTAPEATKKSVSNTSEVTVKTETENVSEAKPNSPTRKKRRIQGFKEDPYVFFDENEEVWPSIKEFYGIMDEVDPKLFLTRCKEGKRKNIYFTSSTVRDLTRINDERITIINTGIKMFARSDNKGAGCEFRIAQEGSSTLMGFMTKRRVTITKADMVMVLTNDSMDSPPEIHQFSSEAAKIMHEMDTGCVLLECYEDGLHIIVVAWKGKTSARAYIANCDRVHYLRLCGADVSKFETNKFANKAANKEIEGTLEELDVHDDITLVDENCPV